MITITALMKAKEGSAGDMAKVIKDFAPKFLKDPGCKMYQVVKRADDPSLFLFYEQYENDEALKFHSSAPHFKEMFGAMKMFLDGKPEIYMYLDI
ncbi:MAG: antibiotic biosynthesis monooxygenase [Dehalococcoidia bacterium]|nr:antibiotic biosynthesis monooxygenase [Dehalococcoidia bacterium]